MKKITLQISQVQNTVKQISPKEITINLDNDMEADKLFSAISESMLKAFIGNLSKENLEVIKNYYDKPSTPNREYIPEEEYDKYLKVKLVFFTCPRCGKKSTVLLQEGDTYLSSNLDIQCRECGETTHLKANELLKGSYKCQCGTSGRFLFNAYTDSVHCKCGKELVIENDPFHQGEYRAVNKGEDNEESNQANK